MMLNKDEKSEQDPLVQASMFGEPVQPPQVERISSTSVVKKLKIKNNYHSDTTEQVISGIPKLVLPTRWEYLQPKISNDDVTIRTIIRPVPRALEVVRGIVNYLEISGGCQILIIRANTGGGKTTFLNTLPYYLTTVTFHSQTLDLQFLNSDEFNHKLDSIETHQDGINLIILEGREKPSSISDEYIQNVIASINRFSRVRKTSLLFVIPTIDEQVARNWCDHAQATGDLIPQGKLYEGSRWYNFPGVPKDKFIQIAEETVTTLNPNNTLYDFGVSQEEVKSWADTAQTIGAFIGILASEISSRQNKSSLSVKGPREHVWIVYCAPDLNHYDHNYLVVRGLVHDERLQAAPLNLIKDSSESVKAANWREGKQWLKFISAINFLDIRLINLPIITVVAAALAYGDDKLIKSFKDTRIIDYKDKIPEAMWPKKDEKISSEDADKKMAAWWNQPLNERRLQQNNARDSMERSNLFLLLRGAPSSSQKGGNPESGKVLSQYLHLRDKTSEQELHYYLGRAIEDLMTHYKFSGFIGVETEEPFVTGQTAPVPDITIFTDMDAYALEFHFFRQQFTHSEMSVYAVNNVIDKYIKTLPHLKSQLDAF